MSKYNGQTISAEQNKKLDLFFKFCADIRYHKLSPIFLYFKKPLKKSKKHLRGWPVYHSNNVLFLFSAKKIEKVQNRQV